MKFKIEYHPDKMASYRIFRKDKFLLIFATWSFIASFEKLTDAELAISNSKGYPKYYKA